MKTRNKNIIVKFPSLFTIDELQELNPDIVTITLRYKTNQAIERGTVAKIGKMAKDVGRPKIIYGKSPINEELKQAAIKLGATLED